MDPQILEKIKNQLLEDKKKLECQLNNFAERNIHNSSDFNAKFPQFGDKDDENASEVATYNDYLTLERTLEKDLRDTVEALQKIEKGDYGICRYCHKPIEEKRLLARPASSACVACKKMLTQEI